MGGIIIEVDGMLLLSNRLSYFPVRIDSALLILKESEQKKEKLNRRASYTIAIANCDITPESRLRVL